MLPRAHRMTSSEHFAATIASGRRAGGASLVVYAQTPHSVKEASGVSDQPTAPTAVGFVVSKAVGNSVVRHRVLRQLRAVCSARLPVLDAYNSVVVRALPAAAGRTSAQLGADLDRALIKVARASRAAGADAPGQRRSR